LPQREPGTRTRNPTVTLPEKGNVRLGKKKKSWRKRHPFTYEKGGSGAHLVCGSGNLEKTTGDEKSKENEGRKQWDDAGISNMLHQRGKMGWLKLHV